MAKKRIIFTLLFEDGNFVLSRNFRRQVVGDYKWLKNNYDFSQVAFYIDELVVLNVSENRKRNSEQFLDVLQELSTDCFVPIAAGGGIESVAYGKEILRSGADKIVVNSLIFDAPSQLDTLASEFGQQAIVASIDVKFTDGKYFVYSHGGLKQLDGELFEILRDLNFNSIGELYINSINRDGTGQGYDFNILSSINQKIPVPLIMAGGVGHAGHLEEGLSNSLIDAVATAHLHNFIGDGLKISRADLRTKGFELGNWLDFSKLNAE